MRVGDGPRPPRRVLEGSPHPTHSGSSEQIVSNRLASLGLPVPEAGRGRHFPANLPTNIQQFRLPSGHASIGAAVDFMDHSFWAGVAIAETANQLALGGLLFAAFLLDGARRADEHRWLAFATASLGCAALSASVALAAAGAIGHGGVSALFAVGAVGLLGATVVARFPVEGPLGRAGGVPTRIWLFPVVLVGSAIVFSSMPVFRQPTAVERALEVQVALSTPGRVLAALVGLGLSAIAAVRFRARGADQASYRNGAVGYFAIASLFLLDAARLSPDFPKVPWLTHAGTLWAVLYGMLLLLGRRIEIHRMRAGEGELASLRAELAESRAVLERLQRELGTKKQLAAVGELAAAIAHEVRNPLAIIMNAAAGLRRPTLQTDDRNTLLGILDEETARLNRLVTDLLRFARPVIIKRSSVSIVELVKRVQGRLEDSAVLEVDIPEDPELRVVQADTNLLRLVFENLVANAFQSMPEGGTVQIVVSGADIGAVPHVRIDIVDRGHGMDPQVLSRATDPFYTTRPSGTGLGLPIVQRIIEAHGGRIDIVSAPARGTTVSMFIPRLGPAELEEAASQ